MEWKWSTELHLLSTNKLGVYLSIPRSTRLIRDVFFVSLFTKKELLAEIYVFYSSRAENWLFPGGPWEIYCFRRLLCQFHWIVFTSANWPSRKACCLLTARCLMIRTVWGWYSRKNKVHPWHSGRCWEGLYSRDHSSTKSGRVSI